MRMFILHAAILACIVSAVAVADNNEQNGHSSVCTVANVAGTYGYVGFGNALPGNPFMVTGPYSSSGTLTFDGKGNLLIIDTARIEDHLLYTDQSFSATYSVDAQCNVTFSLTGVAGGPHYKGVFVNNRKGLRVISLLPTLQVKYVNTTRI